MKTPKFPSFRTYDASESADDMCRDLLAHPTQTVVVRRRLGSQVYWYSYEFDDDLLRKLWSLGPRVHVENALDLHEGDSAIGHSLPQGADVYTVIATSPPSIRPLVVLDNLGTVHAVRAASPTHTVMGTAMPASLQVATATVFPNVEPRKGNEVEPNGTLEYSLRIGPSPEAGVSFPLGIEFPNGAETLELYAELSSVDFTCPTGQSWFQKFRIDRQLNVTPYEWIFEVRAIEMRKRIYSFQVLFQTSGQVLGTLAVTAVLRGSMRPTPPRISSEPLSLPSVSGAKVVAVIGEQANNQCTFTLYEVGKPVLSQVPWNSSRGTYYFKELERATSLQAIEGLGVGLWGDLPPEISDYFDQDTSSDPIAFVSDGRVAPFEILQLRPQQPGPLLGVARPVVRWNSRTPPSGSVDVHRAACIRPEYKGNDALPSAKDEENNLAAQVSNLVRIRKISEFEQNVRSDQNLSLIHFAGHAQGAPAQLMLEDGPLTPTAFLPRYPFMSGGHPFVFLNACRAGAGVATVASIAGNFIKALIDNGCRAVVVPLLEVYSPAASTAAKVFYEAASKGTIAEAVRQVRQLGVEGETPEMERATFLSYAAFASPLLRLEIH